MHSINTILSLITLLFSVSHLNSMSRAAYIQAPRFQKYDKIKQEPEASSIPVKQEDIKPKLEPETDLIPVEIKTSAHENVSEIKMIVAEMTDTYVKAILQCRFAIEQYLDMHRSYSAFLLADIKKDFKREIEQIKLQHPKQNFDSLPDIQLGSDDQQKFLEIFNFLWKCSKSQSDQCLQRYTQLPFPGNRGVSVAGYIVNDSLEKNLPDLYQKWSKFSWQNPTISAWFGMLREMLDNLMIQLQSFETLKEEQKQEAQRKANLWFWQRWWSWFRNK